MIADVETANLLLYTVADEHYALPMSQVREVIRWRTPTPIPGTAAVIAGVIHHRGQVLPLVDLRLVLGFAAATPTRSTRLLVVEHAGLQAALVADAVVDLAAVESGAFEAAPAALPAARAHLVAGLCEWQARSVALLALEAVFTTVKATHAAG
jgi:purine-binding chemotaxis protein CheW